MSWWPIIVYGFAALIAVRVLFALMIQHRRRHLQRLQDEELARREAEAEAATVAEESPDPPTPTRRPAAA
jgi:hypothetical protein